MRSPQDYRELAALYADFARHMSDAAASKVFRDASEQFARAVHCLTESEGIPDQGDL
jgi:hypothetical protein